MSQYVARWSRSAHSIIVNKELLTWLSLKNGSLNRWCNILKFQLCILSTVVSFRYLRHLSEYLKVNLRWELSVINELGVVFLLFPSTESIAQMMNGNFEVNGVRDIRIT